MRNRQKVYATGQEKLDDYSLGVAWFGGSAALLILWLIIQASIPALARADLRTITAVVLCIALLVDVAGLALFGFTRKWIAVGILSGLPVLIVGGAFMAMVMYS